MSKTDKTVVMREFAGRAAEYYRIGLPARAMQEAGYGVVRMDENASEEDFEFNVVMSKILVMWRYVGPLMNDVVRRARNLLQPAVIIDVDDDVFHVDPSNPHYDKHGIEQCRHHSDRFWIHGRDGFDIARNRRIIAGYMMQLRNAAGLTVPTPVMRDRMLRYNDNVAVFPNCVDAELLRPQEHNLKSNSVRIGWFGDISHMNDVEMFFGPVSKYLSANKLDKLVICAENEITEGIFKSVQLSVGRPCVEKHIRFMPIEGHYWRMMALNIDMGLIPLIDTEFNRSRSDVKFTEFASMGVPCVVSNVTPYKGVVVDGETGLLVENTPEAWHDGICRLAKDKKLRKRLGENARQWAIENRDVRLYSQARWDFYHECYKAKRARQDMRKGGVGVVVEPADIAAKRA